MIVIARMAAFVLAILPVLGGTTSLAPRETCNGGSGTLLCCALITSADNPLAASLLSSLGIVPSSVEGPVGVTCAPIEEVPCTVDVVCCADDSFNGVVALGCTSA